jgi:hypothetical protein
LCCDGLNKKVYIVNTTGCIHWREKRKEKKMPIKIADGTELTSKTKETTVNAT